VSAATDAPGEDGAVGEPAALTTVDRYYLAWREYQTVHGECATALGALTTSSCGRFSSPEARAY